MVILNSFDSVCTLTYLFRTDSIFCWFMMFPENMLPVNTTMGSRLPLYAYLYDRLTIVPQRASNGPNKELLIDTHCYSYRHFLVSI